MSRVSRRTVLKGVGLASIAGGVGVWALAGNKKPEQVLEEHFQDALTDLPAATISAAVIRNGEIAWAKSVGYQDLKSQTPASLDSIWPTLGSVSKLVTWTALMQLVESGAVDLDGDVSDYLGFTLRNPSFPDTPITPYHLLTHSSSLSSRKMTSAPDEMAELFCKDDSESLKTWVQARFAPAGQHYDPELAYDDYRPGDFDHVTADPLGVISGYSNVNAMVAALLIESVTSLSFEQYTKKHIFFPLGLTDIGWNKAELDQAKIITPYEAKNSPRPPVMAIYTKSMQDRGYMSQTAFAADGNKRYFSLEDCQYFSSFNAAALLGSSLQALTIFMQSFLPQANTTLLKRETIARMWDIQRQDPITGSLLGLGWFQFSTPRHGVFWGHDGGGPGILSRVMVNPQTGDGVILLINNFFVDFRRRSQLLEELCSAFKVA
ncbi:serine hydrolase domain-containing protein [Photobacterium lutimaris]|uniref:Beta-lactamase-related domain-containing protein n=1 Tax=Photobacterium lutimaris TaxID=388278 RepID=A0A2T3J2T7_9GAMM|nr:serine hydrolase domain-containing protein [Photobacterium lutimaris]PSU35604.1 hypothetical protein C9I99_00865 [Photobacterium lutimaris]TDR78656.1 CubicO group peptidase (beta-lactamase class C family) [Photobacterium lutimaris]